MLLPRELHRHVGCQQIHVDRQQEAADHQQHRQGADETRHMLHIFEDVVGLADEERVAPEMVEALADEGMVEREARQQRARRQDGERHEHHEWRFMHRMLAVAVPAMARMCVVRMIAAAGLVMRVVVDFGSRRLLDVVRSRRVGRVEERHEHEPP